MGSGRNEKTVIGEGVCGGWGCACRGGVVGIDVPQWDVGLYRTAFTRRGRVAVVMGKWT